MQRRASFALPPLGVSPHADWIEDTHGPTCTVTTDINDDWTAECRLVAQDGHPVIAELHIRPRSNEIPAGGLTARRDLRELRFTEVFKIARRNLRILLGEPSVGPAFGFTHEAVESPRQPRRSGHDDRWYAALAAEYVTLCETSPRPVVELAKRHNLARDHMRDHLHQARERGLLVPGAKGKAGGELTDKTRTLLQPLGGHQ